MYIKAMTFGNMEAAAQILVDPDPAKCIQIGKTVAPMPVDPYDSDPVRMANRNRWESRRWNATLLVLFYKRSVCIEFKDALEKEIPPNEEFEQIEPHVAVSLDLERLVETQEIRGLNIPSWYFSLHRVSYLDTNLAFAAAPRPSLVHEWVRDGKIPDVIIDLTDHRLEHPNYVFPFETEIINFPIKDQRTTRDHPTRSLVYRLVNFLRDGKKVIIHCKGGHGRSAMVACMVFKIWKNLDPDWVLQYARQVHDRTHHDLTQFVRVPGTTEQYKQYKRIVKNV